MISGSKNVINLSTPYTQNSKRVSELIHDFKNDDEYNKMIESQKKYISSSSAKDLVEFIKNKYYK